MCGIVGLVGGGPPAQMQKRQNELHRMNETLHHRGPDDAGLWMEPEIDVALAQRRLAIIDVSPLGHQPMVSPSGRWVLTCNGEIYNFRELRAELEAKGHSFRGACDIEVLLIAIDRWGVPEALSRVSGMFAFAAWDRAQREIWIARDRLGEKPLSYALQNGRLLFASELRAIAAADNFDATLDRGNISGFLRFNYYPGTTSPLHDVRKLAPGHYARLPIRSLADRAINRVEQIECRPYWDAPQRFREARKSEIRGSLEDATSELDQRFRQVVTRQMISDVPLGAFLSGGIDSSLVVATMTQVSPARVKTFTIGYEDAEFDEAPHARRVAEHLGTEHHEVRVTSADALDVARRIGELYDEPFADQSQIPTYLVSRAARRNVTVALTGDGGDEVFGGYNRHVWSERVWSTVNSLPRGMRTVLAGASGALSQPTWDRVGEILRHTGIRALSHNGLGLKVQKLRDCLAAQDPADLYTRLSAQWRSPEILVRGAAQGGQGSLYPDVGASLAQSMMLWDAIGYLPGDILTKVDRASMANGLETRAPFLDHELVEWGWRLPLNYKVSGSTGKLILRNLLKRHLPSALFERPKQGFGIPLSNWLRGPLKPWASGLLDRDRLRAEGIFEDAVITDAWNRHLSGAEDLSQRLWGVLMFQLWSERFTRQRTANAA